MNPLASAILITWKRNAAYGRRLVEDLAPERWLAQPLPGRTLNHPAWIFSHLNLYGPIVKAMMLGEPFEDPASHAYGPSSSPLAESTAYQSPQVLLESWLRVHEDAAKVLASADAATTSAINPLGRWREVHPTVGDMLVTLMVKHESGHLGQLSAWRRAMGMPSVAV